MTDILKINSEATHARLYRLCMEVGVQCGKLNTDRCVDFRVSSPLLEIQQWVLADDGLLVKMGEIQSICEELELGREAERLRELRFRVSDYMVGVLGFTTDPENDSLIGECRGLCWAVKDLGELVNSLPEKIISKDNSDVPQELPVVIKQPGGDIIEWNAARYPVGTGWADAFQAMLDEKGRPVGLSRYLRKPAEDLPKLKAQHPELAALIVRADGNKGYYLNLLSPPISA